MRRAPRSTADRAEAPSGLSFSDNASADSLAVDDRTHGRSARDNARARSVITDHGNIGGSRAVGDQIESSSDNAANTLRTAELVLSLQRDIGNFAVHELKPDCAADKIETGDIDVFKREIADIRFSVFRSGCAAKQAGAHGRSGRYRQVRDGMACSIKRSCEGIIRMKDFRILRRVRQRPERADRLPVFITGQINVGDENIVTGQIFTNEIQLFRGSDLPGVFLCAASARKTSVRL